MSVISNIWSTAWPIAAAILAFLVMIAIHEFGHFIAAKLTGVRVNEYSIGFGPAIFKKQGKETLYAVRILPFGGYCAMEGEDETSSDPRAFCNARAWKRFIIIVAGAFFNLLLGFIIVMITLIPQKMYASNIVAQFDENAVSCNYGLKVNDEILEIDGRKIYTYYDLSYAFTNKDGGKINILVERDGKEVELKDVRFATKTDKDITYLTLDFKVYGYKNSFGNFIKQSFKTTLSFGAVVWRSLIDLICGRYGISAVSGPVGVTAAMSTAAKFGIMNFLPIIALITINLGIFNMLPVPALDGSRALFILIEIIFRKPVPAKYEKVIHAVGLAALLLFAALISIKDIVSLF